MKFTEELLIEAQRRFKVGDKHGGMSNSEFKVLEIHWSSGKIYGGLMGCIYDPKENRWATNLSRKVKIIQIY